MRAKNICRSISRSLGYCSYYMEVILLLSDSGSIRSYLKRVNNISWLFLIHIFRLLPRLSVFLHYTFQLKPQDLWPDCSRDQLIPPTNLQETIRQASGILHVTQNNPIQTMDFISHHNINLLKLICLIHEVCVFWPQTSQSQLNFQMNHNNAVGSPDPTPSQSHI